MSLIKPERTDLVINMTLAEIFLLLLFAVWYSRTSINDPDIKAHLEEKLVRIEKENQILKNDLSSVKNQISDLQKRLNWWRTIFPRVDEFTSEGNARSQAGRGFAECLEDDNTLIHAYVINGKISMVCDTASGNFLEWLENSHRTRPKFGVRITNRDEINAFLTIVRDYYQYRELSTECRFDYQLTYVTKEDYYDGRELFERYFYPAGIIHTTRDSN